MKGMRVAIFNSKVWSELEEKINEWFEQMEKKYKKLKVYEMQHGQSSVNQCITGSSKMVTDYTASIYYDVYGGE